jgi:nickel-dependent lactate racemase
MSTASLAFRTGRSTYALHVPEWVDLQIASPPEPPEPPSLDVLYRQAVDAPIGDVPLRERVRAGQRVAVLFDDATRPTPTAALFRMLEADLLSAGVGAGDIIPVYAPGLHQIDDRQPQAKYGSDLLRHPRLVRHDFRHSKLACKGVTSRGVPVFVNAVLDEVDFAIGLGQITPHMDAGFGGGGKIILPGVSGKPTVEQNHAFMVAPGSRLARIDGNPVREDIDEAAGLTNLAFIVNTVTDNRGRVAHMAVGDPLPAHRAGASAKMAMLGYALPEPVDVAVVLTDADYLLAAMGPMLYADRAVRLGGEIIVAAPSRLGWASEPDVHAELVPDESLIRKSAAELAWIVADRDVSALRLATTVFNYRRTAEEKRVTLVSERFGPADASEFGFAHAESVQAALERALDRAGRPARVLVMPEPARTLPILPRLEGVVWRVDPYAEATRPGMERSLAGKAATGT